MARRRGFGEVERRVSASAGVSYRARYAMPDGTRYSRSFGTKMDAEAWLATERSLIDREEWTPPAARRWRPSDAPREPSRNTVGTFAERYLVERDLRPTTVRNYQTLLDSRILPYFGEMPLRDVTLSEIKKWRASLDPETESTNAAAYRLLRSILQAAEEEELIDRAPPKIRGAGTAPVKQVAVPATLDEIAVIIDAMPERLQAAHRARRVRRPAGGRAARAAPLRRRRRHRPDQRHPQGRQGRADRCDPRRLPAVRSRRSARRRRRAASAPSTSRRRSSRCCRSTCSSTPPTGPTGLLFPGDRTDHMSVRYLMDRYRPAREPPAVRT